MEWIIGLPALGHTAANGTIREWLKSVGDKVVRTEPVVVVESDKASLEIEAPADGVLIEILVEAGTEVPTGTILGKIGEAKPALAAGASAAAGSLALDAKDEAKAPVFADREEASASLSDVQRALRQGIRSTPLARRTAASSGLDIRSVSSAHSDGVIRKHDVLRAIANQPVRGPGLSNRPAPMGFSAMRKAISRRMTEAWRNQPMVTLFRSIDVTRLVEWRKERGKTVGVTAVLAAAMARVLTRHPQLNGTIENDQIFVGPDVNLAIAIALDKGLVAPVIHSAHVKAVSDMHNELRALVNRSRSGILQPAATEGATASLSNLGNFGISTFTPLLTPPQIAVLGIGAIERVFREAGSGFAFRSELQVSLTFDHRAVDGADGARFLQDLDALLQAPGQLDAPIAVN